MAVVIVGESDLDLVVLQRLCANAGVRIGRAIARNGKASLDQLVARMVRSSPDVGQWVFVRDLDRDSECAAAYALTHPTPQHVQLRLAVRQIESWLLSDRRSAARFFGVAESRVPRDPEAEVSAKERLVALATGSRFRTVKEGVGRGLGAHVRVGSEYVGMLSEFVREKWSPEAAAENSESLRRCRAALERLRDA